MEQSTVGDNVAHDGGGLYLGRSIAHVTDSTKDNTAMVTDAYGTFETDPALIRLPAGHPVYLPLVLRQTP